MQAAAPLYGTSGTAAGTKFRVVCFFKWRDEEAGAVTGGRKSDVTVPSQVDRVFVVRASLLAPSKGSSAESASMAGLDSEVQLEGNKVYLR